MATLARTHAHPGRPRRLSRYWRKLPADGRGVGRIAATASVAAVLATLGGLVPDGLSANGLPAIPAGITSIETAAASPGAESGQTGGSMVVVKPKLKAVGCRRSCARKRGIRAGSLIRITGENLGGVGSVIFLGSHGPTDDVMTAVARSAPKSLVVRVPIDASTGPLVAIGPGGERSRPTAPIAIRPRPPVIGSPDLTPLPGFQGPPGVSLETGTSSPRVVFFGAKELVRFSLRVRGTSATANILLVRQGTGETVATWNVPAPDGQVVSVDWNGLAGGVPAPSGRFAFRVTLDLAPVATSASASASADNRIVASASDDRDAFDLYDSIFPVRGKHNFGQFAAKFGGGRGHQGQDIMAACNTKLVAARGGVVVESRYQSRAGNFLVIRPDLGGGDNAYMHLASPSPFKSGDRVYTGQVIGNVGQTGRASGCHLHFEQWTGEIWRSRPVDPLPQLLAWDQVS